MGCACSNDADATGDQNLKRAASPEVAPEHARTACEVEAEPMPPSPYFGDDAEESAVSQVPPGALPSALSATATRTAASPTPGGGSSEVSSSPLRTASAHRRPPQRSQSTAAADPVAPQRQALPGAILSVGAEGGAIEMLRAAPAEDSPALHEQLPADPHPHFRACSAQSNESRSPQSASPPQQPFPASMSASAVSPRAHRLFEFGEAANESGGGHAASMHTLTLHSGEERAASARVAQPGARGSIACHPNAAHATSAVQDDSSNPLSVSNLHESVAAAVGGATCLEPRSPRGHPPPDAIGAGSGNAALAENAAASAAHKASKPGSPMRSVGTEYARGRSASPGEGSDRRQRGPDRGFTGFGDSAAAVVSASAPASPLQSTQAPAQPSTPDTANNSTRHTGTSRSRGTGVAPSPPIPIDEPRAALGTLPPAFGQYACHSDAAPPSRSGAEAFGAYDDDDDDDMLGDVDHLCFEKAALAFAAVRLCKSLLASADASIPQATRAHLETAAAAAEAMLAGGAALRPGGHRHWLGHAETLEATLRRVRVMRRDAPQVSPIDPLVAPLRDLQLAAPDSLAPNSSETAVPSPPAVVGCGLVLAGLPDGVPDALAAAADSWSTGSDNDDDDDRVSHHIPTNFTASVPTDGAGTATTATVPQSSPAVHAVASPSQYSPGAEPQASQAPGAGARELPAVSAKRWLIADFARFSNRRVMRAGKAAALQHLPLSADGHSLAHLRNVSQDGHPTRASPSSAGFSATDDDEDDYDAYTTHHHGMDEVAPGLFCGSVHPTMYPNELAGDHVDYVVSCLDASKGARAPDVALDMLDEPSQPLAQASALVREAICRNCIGGGRGLLVHCGSGVSRAPAVIAFALCSRFHLDAETALLIIRTGRPQIMLNDGFRAQLAEAFPAARNTSLA